MTKVLVWVLLALASAVLGAELVAWSGPLQRWVLRSAARALPPFVRERYYEEWLAELQEVPDGPVTRALWVFSLYARRRSLARALGSNVRGLLLKRVIDVAVSGLALLLAAPVLCLIMVAIRLETPGPAFFTRLGLTVNDRPFPMLYFRTYSAAGRTRVGRWLQRFSLHELPLLFNVLVGDMSLVGRRPDSSRPEQLSPEHLDVKPGLTGLWALVPNHGALLDERYASWRSTTLDLRILSRTIFGPLKRR